MEGSHRRAVRMAFALGAVAALVSCTRSDPCQTARTAENRGMFDKAQQAYAELLVASAQPRALPDRSQVPTLKPEQFLEQVGGFVDWIRAVPTPPDSLVRLALDGLERCSSSVKQMTFPTLPVPKPLALPDYRELWHTAFFPEFVPLHDIQGPLIGTCHGQALSFVRVTARKSYSYEGLLVECESGKAVAVSIYYEGSLLIPARPGRHLLVVRAKTQFASGSTWTSPYSVISLQIPDATVLFPFTLNTTVERNAK
jgi:hypothetical protein